MATSAYQVQRSREANVIHDMARTVIYRRWLSMKRRCLNKYDKQYPFYGGRGITVCERWLDFRMFYTDMGDIPFPGATLERIDNDAGYSAKNCRWATTAEQNRNKSSLWMLTIDGQTKCATEWARIYGVAAYNVLNRLRRGWSARKALTARDWRINHE